MKTENEIEDEIRKNKALISNPYAHPDGKAAAGSWVCALEWTLGREVR